MKLKLCFFILIFLVFIASTNLVLASCGEGEVDINSASAEELDGLAGIGPVKAQAIIDARPFDTLDDLLDVNGIGEVTLEKIKDQGIACVEEEGSEEEESKDEKEEKEEENKVIENTEKEIKEETNYIENNSPIYLNSITPQNIKSYRAPDENRSGEFAKYSLIAFCVLLLLLYILKAKKKKNEFQK